jgi:hypothetical protein
MTRNPGESDDRVQSVLVRVLIIQALSLLVLWALQARYHQ